MTQGLKFFALDLHISVIADIRHILRNLGQEVVDWTLSNHSWVMGRKRDRVDVVNQSNWHAIDPSMCDAFYRRYRDELGQYDAFIVTHTPCLAMLYERWNKPVVVVASTRYEQPFASDAGKWAAFNDYLRRQRDSGLLIPLANNRYDAAYAKAFTGFDWPVIPSLCEYVNAPARFERPEFLYWGRFDEFPRPVGLLDRHQALAVRTSLWQKLSGRFGSMARGYAWSSLAAYSGVVHLPYNASIMSLFEHYWSNLPLLLPTQAYLRELYAAHRMEGVLSQLSFNSVYGLRPGSAITPLDGPDPNQYDDIDAVMSWLRLADYYENEDMPHVVYFGPGDDLADKMNSVDPREIGARMRATNRVRRQRVYGAWQSVLDDLAVRLGG